MGSDAPMEGEEGEVGEVGKQMSDLSALHSKLSEMETKLAGLEEAKAATEKRAQEAEEVLTSPDYLDFLATQGVDKGKGAGRTAPVEEEKALDFDTMAPAEVAQHVVGAAEKRAAAKFVEMEKRMAAISDGIGRALAEVDLTFCKLHHPDMEAKMKERAYRDRLEAVCKANPQWNAEKVYSQAEMEMERERGKAEAGRKAREAEELAATTEKGSAPRVGVKGKRLSEDEAADLAHRKAFSSEEK